MCAAKRKSLHFSAMSWKTQIVRSSLPALRGELQSSLAFSAPRGRQTLGNEIGGFFYVGSPLRAVSLALDNGDVFLEVEACVRAAPQRHAGLIARTKIAPSARLRNGSIILIAFTQ